MRPIRVFRKKDKVDNSVQYMYIKGFKQFAAAQNLTPTGVEPTTTRILVVSFTLKLIWHLLLGGMNQ